MNIDSGNALSFQTHLHHDFQFIMALVFLEHCILLMKITKISNLNKTGVYTRRVNVWTQGNLILLYGMRNHYVMSIVRYVRLRCVSTSALWSGLGVGYQQTTFICSRFQWFKSVMYEDSGQ